MASGGRGTLILLGGPGQGPVGLAGLDGAGRHVSCRRVSSGRRRGQRGGPSSRVRAVGRAQANRLGSAAQVRGQLGPGVTTEVPWVLTSEHWGARTGIGDSWPRLEGRQGAHLGWAPQKSGTDPLRLKLKRVVSPLRRAGADLGGS